MALKERIKNLLDVLKQGVVERDSFLQLIFLSILTNQSIYVFGRSGAGKGLLVGRATRAFKNNNVLVFGKRTRMLPEDFNEFDMVHFKSFDGSEVLTQKAINVIVQEFKGKPIVISGERRAESSLCEAGVIDHIYLVLSLPETLKPESLQKLLAMPDDVDLSQIPEELLISQEEKTKWLSEISKVSLSPEVLELIGKFSADCDAHKAYVSVRRWKHLTKMMKAIAYFNDRKEVILTDTFFLGMPIWNRTRNNEVLCGKFFVDVEEILLKGLPVVGDMDEAASTLRHTAEHLLNVSDDLYDTVDFAGEKCLKYNVKISGENVPLYVPEKYIGTHEQFNPFNELRQKESHVLCNFDGSTECTIYIDSSVKGDGIRSSMGSNVGKSFERFAKLPARVLEINNAEKQKHNREAFEKFRKSLDDSMESYATAMIKLKATYKDLKSYTDDPFFNAEFYGRIQSLIKNKFEQSNKMINLLRDVRIMMDAPRAQ